MDEFLVSGMVYRTKTKTVPVKGGPFRDVIGARIYADAVRDTAASLNLRSSIRVYAQGASPMREVYHVTTAVSS